MICHMNPKCWYISFIKITLYDNPETSYIINEIILMHSNDPNIQISFEYIQCDNHPLYHKRIETLYENDIILHQEERIIHYRELMNTPKDEITDISVDKDEIINMWLFERKLPLLLNSTPITIYDNYILLQISPKMIEFQRSSGPDYLYDGLEGIRKIIVYEYAIEHIKDILPIEMGCNVSKFQYNISTYNLFLNTSKWFISSIYYIEFFNHYFPFYIINEYIITHPQVPFIQIRFKYLKKTHLNYQTLSIEITENNEIVQRHQLLINTYTILNYQRLIKTTGFDCVNEWLFKKKLPMLLNSIQIEQTDDILKDVLIFRRLSQNLIICGGPSFQYKKNKGIEKRQIYKNAIYNMRTLLPNYIGKKNENIYHAYMFEFVMRKNPFFYKSSQNIDNIISFINPFITKN